LIYRVSICPIKTTKTLAKLRALYSTDAWRQSEFRHRIERFLAEHQERVDIVKKRQVKPSGTITKAELKSLFTGGNLPTSIRYVLKNFDILLNYLNFPCDNSNMVPVFDKTVPEILTFLTTHSLADCRGSEGELAKPLADVVIKDKSFQEIWKQSCKKVTFADYYFWRQPVDTILTHFMSRGMTLTPEQKKYLLANRFHIANVTGRNQAHGTRNYSDTVLTKYQSTMLIRWAVGTAMLCSREKGIAEITGNPNFHTPTGARLGESVYRFLSDKNLPITLKNHWVTAYNHTHDRVTIVIMPDENFQALYPWLSFGIALLPTMCDTENQDSQAWYCLPVRNGLSGSFCSGNANPASYVYMTNLKGSFKKAMYHLFGSFNYDSSYTPDAFIQLPISTITERAKMVEKSTFFKEPSKTTSKSHQALKLTTKLPIMQIKTMGPKDYITISDTMKNANSAGTIDYYDLSFDKKKMKLVCKEGERKQDVVEPPESLESLQPTLTYLSDNNLLSQRSLGFHARLMKRGLTAKHCLSKYEQFLLYFHETYGVKEDWRVRTDRNCTDGELWGLTTPTGRDMTKISVKKLKKDLREKLTLSL
jgi:hypothetical protein